MKLLKWNVFTLFVVFLIAIWSFLHFSYSGSYTAVNYNTKPEMIYSDISHCLKPHYLKEYKAHCWGECKEGEVCQEPVSYEDTTAKRAELKCLGNLNLVGVRKSGTTGVLSWFIIRKDIAVRHSDFRIKDMQCPIDYFSACSQTKDCNQNLGAVYFNKEQLQKGYFQSSPGNLLINDKVTRNSTHITISTPMQYLGFMSTPETKFYVQLRNPTERTISYLFHWHNKKWQNLFSNMTLEEMDGKFVDGVIRTYLHKLEKCIKEHGDFYCAYLSDGLDGDLNCLLQHSMYVVYIKEAFKFIPKSQFLFTTIDEYSKNNVKSARQLNQFFGLTLPEKIINSLSSKNRQNVGSKNPVWASTRRLLDEFYAPYNRELAHLLDDDKWLFKTDT
ncbi:uncharacterized protein [Watersipora subatra]|uniref:uncharacterized protein n=1 Tax=Watersipora subatra TaxID=2589382 RepID=UPI00355BF582